MLAEVNPSRYPNDLLVSVHPLRRLPDIHYHSSSLQDCTLQHQKATESPSSACRTFAFWSFAPLSSLPLPSSLSPYAAVFSPITSHPPRSYRSFRRVLRQAGLNRLQQKSPRVPGNMLLPPSSPVPNKSKPLTQTRAATYSTQHPPSQIPPLPLFSSTTPPPPKSS